MKSNDVVINIVDQLGANLAAQDALKKQAKALKKQIIAKVGKSQFVDGDLFRATLVVAFRDSLIADKVREYLSPQQLVHATQTVEVRSLKLTSKPQ